MWELFKIGSSTDFDSRKKVLEWGLNEISDFSYSTEDVTSNLSESDIRNSFKLNPLRDESYSLDPFFRVVGKGRTYKVNPIIRDIDKNLFNSLKQIIDIKTDVYSKEGKYASSWGVTEFILRKCN